MQKRQVLVLTLLLVFLQCDGMGQSSNGIGSIFPLTSSAYQKKGASNMAVSLLPAAADFNGQQRISIAAENRFMIKELSTLRFGWARATEQHVIKCGGAFQGSSLYSHAAFDAGYTLRLNKQLNAGLTLGVEAGKLKGDRTALHITAQGGMVFFVQERIGWGLHLKTSTPIGEAVHTTAGIQEISSGIGFLLSESIYLSAEWGTGSSNKKASNLAVNWMLTEKIGLMGGISNPMGNLFLGLGKKGKRELLFIGLSSHAMLGMSGMIVLDYALDQQ